MFLLARSLKLEPGVALFAGALLMVAPMHIEGLWGHVDKINIELLPLALLFFHYAVNPKKSAWWAVGVALTVLLAFLHSGYHFLFASIGVGILFVLEWFAPNVRCVVPLSSSSGFRPPR